MRSADWVSIPDELEGWVEAVYGVEPPVPDGHWQPALDASREGQTRQLRAKQAAAKAVSIRRPTAEDLFAHQSLDLADDDNPAKNQKLQALTRDTEPTVQFIVAYGWGGGLFLDPKGVEPLDLDQEVHLWEERGRELTRRLLMNEVTVSHRGCVAHYLSRPAPAGWAENGMLRFHRVAFVDPGGGSLPGEYPFTVDRDLGLLFTRDEEGGP